MRMNAKTLAALRGSIVKWKKIVARTGADNGKENCDLCVMFYHLSCNGCPVYKASGHIYCRTTPYEAWVQSTLIYQRKLQIKKILPSATEAAKAELKFLKSLLPKPKRRA